MDAQETYDLYKQGKGEWNAWADALNKQRSELNRQKSVLTEGEWNKKNEAWEMQAKTDFSLVAEHEKHLSLKFMDFPDGKLCINGIEASSLTIGGESINILKIKKSDIEVINIIDLENAKFHIENMRQNKNCCDITTCN